MWQSIKEKLGILATLLLGIFIALFAIEKTKREEAEVKLTEADTDAKDKELAQQQNELAQQNIQIEKQAEEQKKQPMDQQQTIDMLNKIGE
jgi:Na+/glutamate symporter